MPGLARSSALDRAPQSSLCHLLVELPVRHISQASLASGTGIAMPFVMMYPGGCGLYLCDAELVSMSVPMMFIAKASFSMGHGQCMGPVQSAATVFVPKGLGFDPGCSVVRCYTDVHWLLAASW